MSIKRNLPFASFTAQIAAFQPAARLFLLATIIDGIVYSAWSLFFNFYILERGFGRDFLGLVNAMPSIASLLLGIPIGLLSDRIGRRRAMLLGVAVSILCMGLQVTVASPPLILIMAFLSGAAGSLYFLSQAPFMMKVSDENSRTLLFSLNFGLVTLSGAVGSLFAGQLPALFGSWLDVPAGSYQAYQAVLLVSVGLSFATLMPLYLIDEGRRTEDERRRTVDDGRLTMDDRQKMKDGSCPSSVVRRPSSAFTDLKLVLRKGLTYKLALPNLLIGFGAAILIPYMNVFFREQHDMTDSALGVMFSISAVLTGVGSIVGPRLSSNLGSKIKAVVLTQGLSLAFLLVVGFSPYLGIAVIGFLMRGTLMNMAVPLYSAFAMEQVRERERATVNSVKETAWQMGWAAGPYLSGLVQEQYGFRPLFLTTAVMYGVSILITWAFFRGSEGTRREAREEAEIAVLEGG
jgi:MFS family permease